MTNEEIKAFLDQFSPNEQQEFFDLVHRSALQFTSAMLANGLETQEIDIFYTINNHYIRINILLIIFKEEMTTKVEYMNCRKFRDYTEFVAHRYLSTITNN